MRTLPALALLSFAAAPLAAAGERSHWPQFRGPGGTGIAEGGVAVPLEFGPDRNLLWKTPLPEGHSSPVIWGDRIFLTGYRPDEKRLETLALDRASGRILWQRAVPTTSIEPVYEINNPAAPTPVTDGKAVFVYFGSYGLVAYDLDGRELWSQPLPMVKTYRNQGSATSPILAGGLLVLDVHLDKDSYLLAVHPDTGKTAWKALKPEVNGGWSTPVVWTEGAEALVGVANPGRFTAHSLRDGSERWWVSDLPFQSCATPVAGEGVLFISASGTQGEIDNLTLPPGFDEMIGRYDRDQNGRIEASEIPETLLVTDRRASTSAGNLSVRRLLTLAAGAAPPPTSYERAQWDAIVKLATDFAQGPYMRSAVLAVRTGGSGDVTKTHVAWTESRVVPEVPSPLLYKDRLYLVKNGGIAIAREAATGKTVFQGRLGAPGGYYASPVVAGGRIYVASDAGAVVVFNAADDLDVVARNELPEPILATPAIVDGTIFVRTTAHLYAFGAAAPTK